MLLIFTLIINDMKKLTRLYILFFRKSVGFVESVLF